MNGKQLKEDWYLFSYDRGSWPYYLICAVLLTVLFASPADRRQMPFKEMEGIAVLSLGERGFELSFRPDDVTGEQGSPDLRLLKALECLAERYGPLEKVDVRQVDQDMTTVVLVRIGNPRRSSLPPVGEIVRPCE